MYGMSITHKGIFPENKTGSKATKAVGICIRLKGKQSYVQSLV